MRVVVFNAAGFLTLRIVSCICVWIRHGFRLGATLGSGSGCDFDRLRSAIGSKLSQRDGPEAQSSNQHYQMGRNSEPEF